MGFAHKIHRSIAGYVKANTVELGFRNLGFRAFPWFRALVPGNQIWFYDKDLPGFRNIQIEACLFNLTFYKILPRFVAIWALCSKFTCH